MPESSPTFMQPEPSIVEQPLMVERTIINRIKRPIAIALTALGSFGIAGCGGDNVLDSANTSSTTAASAGSNGDSISPTGDASEAEPVTDQILKSLDLSTYNCGGHLQPETPEGKYGIDYAINYYNENPELGIKIRQFHIDTLGEDGWQSLLDNGIGNSNTDASLHFTDVSEEGKQVDELLHLRSRAALDAPHVYANYSCISGGEVNIHRASNKPTISISAGSHVEGVRLNDAGYADFMSKVKKNSDGQPAVDTIDLGMQTIIVDGQERQEHQLLVVLYANGCLNPILLLIKSPEHPSTTPPGTTPDTVPEGTTTTTGSENTTPTTSCSKCNVTTTLSAPPVTVGPATTVNTDPNDTGDGAPPNDETVPPTVQPPVTPPPTNAPPSTIVTYSANKIGQAPWKRGR